MQRCLRIYIAAVLKLWSGAVSDSALQRGFRWRRQVGDEAVMVAGDGPVDRFHEGEIAPGDAQCRAAAPAAADQDVVDPAEWPVGRGQRVLGSKRISRLSRVGAVPGVAVAHA